MGSSSKKHKDREPRKKRTTSDLDEVDYSREKRHKHHHKHKHRRDKERKRDKTKSTYSSDDSEVIEVQIDQNTRKSSPERNSDHNSEEANNSASVESLSIEETNKLRAKLGLKPLEVGSSAPKSSKDQAESENKYKDDWGEFHHKPAENWKDKAQQEKIRAKLLEQRDKRRLHSKYSKIKSLGQSDSEEDTSNWIDKSRKIEEARKEAERRAKTLEELDAQFGVDEIIESEVRHRRRLQYTSTDLKGLKVDHNIDDIEEERNIILTLKDRGVLEEEDDVLVNVNMVDKEKQKKNLENRKKSSLYNCLEEEFDQFGNPIEKSVLSKYDEEIHGEKKETFLLGSDISFEARKQQAAISDAERSNITKKKLEKIAEKELKVASEYYDESELAKFKKPKKKLRKIRPKGKLLSADDLENMNNEARNVGSRKSMVKPEDLNIDDTPDINIPTDFTIDEKDDELEQAIHRARRIKQKENVVAELIQNSIIKTEIKEEPIDNGNIVLNTTAEFCRTLGDIPTYGKAGNRDETEDLDMDFESNVKDDNSDEDVEIIETTGWNSIDPNESVKVAEAPPQEVQILDEEPDVSKGMGAALKVAMSKGYLEKELKNRPSNSRLAHLQAQHYSIEDKVYGEDGERGGGRRGDRYAGPIQDFKEKDTFKPNVKLEYIDDDGRILNSKEAFRYLSHKFHGKGPGKNKVEKRINKNVQEQLMKKMSSTDTPLGTLNMLQAKQKESQSPFVVLSGNKQSQSTIISKVARH